MAEHAVEHTTIDAPLEACYAVALDIERYPEWARDIKQAEVLSRDDEGRALEAAFRTAAMGRSTSYTLRYDHTEAPHRLAWELVRGDLTRKLDGEYRFARRDGDPARTDITYELEAELVVPLPGFVKRRAEAKIVHTALRELKVEAEAQHAAGGPA